MSFTRVKPSGWAFGEILTSAQMNSLDVDHAAAIDGGGGGDYSPTAVIGIKGNGLSIGKAIGDDTYLSTANAKWAGALSDFSAGSTIALRLVDLCSYAEGILLAVASNAADKIAYSRDDGITWKDISSNIASPQTITLQCCAAKAATMIAAGNTAKVYYSVDAATWAFVTCGGSPTELDIAHYNSALDLFIVIGATASDPYIASITSSIVATQRTVPASITGSSYGVSIAEAKSGAHAGRMVASWHTQTNVAYSDNGTTWAASTTSLASGDYIVAFGDGVFVALDATVGKHAYVSTDGDTWTSSGVAYPSTFVVTSFSALNGVFEAIDTQNVLWVSVNKGATWESVSLLYYSSSAWNAHVKLRAVGKRMHCLQTDSSSTVDMRSRRLGFADGTI